MRRVLEKGGAVLQLERSNLSLWTGWEMDSRQEENVLVEGRTSSVIRGHLYRNTRDPFFVGCLKKLIEIVFIILRGRKLKCPEDKTGGRMAVIPDDVKCLQDKEQRCTTTRKKKNGWDYNSARDL
ncbi:hypothetical protein CEXT_537001 [Caerostris extrusa]|uniref:Uncharacterized protein n=1 Tax=Caerostris extrusa TaxID=172846 RepID=A0AAV4P3Q4_CAEEX|nr:hypothetical protein CEXT_537001 [Caerostris extrusa]